MNATDCDTCYCSIEGILDTLGKKYSIQILCILSMHSTLRFKDIEDHLPVASTSTLSRRLDELVEADLIRREQYAEIPPRVEYEFTETGKQLANHLHALMLWDSKHTD